GLRSAMITVSNGGAELPIRTFMPVGGSEGKMAIMPGALRDPWCFGIKLVAKYPRAADSPYGTHEGMVLLFDAELGLPVALIEGATLTGIRTAAASALATDLLARSDASNLLVIGCGEQARRHVTALRTVRDFREILIWGRSADRAEALANQLSASEGVSVRVAPDLQRAAATADVITTVTSAREPVLHGDWVSPGTHVNLVGSAVPTNREVDRALVTRARYYVDYRPAALAAASELLEAIEAGALDETHIVAEIGAVAHGSALGRRDETEITVYKSLGVAAQDLAAAHAVYSQAVAEGVGVDIDLMDTRSP
ncbi:MAG: ornithine cyclodeaminase family protein, partial [Chromatocurvus sp.]